MESLKNIWINRQKINFNAKNSLFALFGGFFGIFILAAFSNILNYNILLAPFGASCVLIFALPESPLAQPRNVIFGHLLTAFVGLIFLKLFGFNVFSVSFAVGFAIAIMRLTNTTHPPAGANPIVVMILNSNWDFLLSIFVGATVLVICGTIYSKINGSNYPKYWL